MKKSKPAAAPTSSSSKTAEHDAKRIEVLFLRFSVIYGYVWQKVYQNESLLRLAKKEWQATLHPFNNHIIKGALHHCREHCPFPPSLPQFIELCKVIKKRENFFTASLEHEDIASPEVAQMHLQKIRAQLQPRDAS